MSRPPAPYVTRFNVNDLTPTLKSSYAASNNEVGSHLRPIEALTSSDASPNAEVEDPIEPNSSLS